MRELVVEAEGAAIHLWVDGAGPPFVFLHAQRGAASVVWPFVEPLAGSFTIAVPDLRGRGASVCRDPRLHTWERHADDVAQIVDVLEQDRVALGGVSFGAGVALATALRHPGRVEALVLHSPPYRGSELGWLPDQEERIDQFLHEAEIVGKGEWPEAPMAPMAWSRHDAASIAAAFSGIGKTQPFASLSTLGGIDVPTLIVPGNDVVHQTSVGESYRDAIPGSKLMTTPVPFSAGSFSGPIGAFLRSVR